MDAAVWGLIGVVAGASLSALLGSVLGHRRWVKEVRLDAYVEYLAVLARVTGPSGDADALLDQMANAGARALVVSPEYFTESSDEMVDAAIALREKPDDEAAQKRYKAARTAYSVLARKQTMSWRTRRA